MTNKIKRIYTRHYRDNGQLVAYVEWADGARTEGQADRSTNPRHPTTFSFGTHMHALFNRAKREGLTMQREVWG